MITNYIVNIGDQVKIPGSSRKWQVVGYSKSNHHDSKGRPMAMLVQIKHEYRTECQEDCEVVK